MSGYSLRNKVIVNLRNILLFKCIRFIFHAFIQKVNAWSISKCQNYEIKYNKDKGCRILHGRKIKRDDSSGIKIRRQMNKQYLAIWKTAALCVEETPNAMCAVGHLVSLRSKFKTYWSGVMRTNVWSQGTVLQRTGDEIIQIFMAEWKHNFWNVLIKKSFSPLPLVEGSR